MIVIREMSETVRQWDSEIAIRCPPTAGNSHSECSEESWCMTVVTQLSVNTDRREGSEGSEGAKGKVLRFDGPMAQGFLSLTGLWPEG